MESSALSPRGPGQVAGTFSRFERLTVRQRRRWLEVLLSFEFKNAYDVYDGDRAVLNAREVGEGVMEFFRRALLGPLRPFEMEVTDLATGQVVLRIRRPFKFYFHRIEIFGPDGRKIGAVARRWSWLRRIYTLEDPSGAPVAELFGPILKPWTFEVRVQGARRGVISKRWSGLGRELFTDADNFGVELADLPPDLRAVAFAATVLVDVVHFERAKG